MEIKTLKVECSKSKKIPGFEFSSQKFGISIDYQNVPYEFNPSDVEQHCVEIHSFLAEIIDHRLGLIYSKPKPEDSQPVIINAVEETSAKQTETIVSEVEEPIKNPDFEKPNLCTYKQLNCIKAKCKAANISKESLLDKIAACYNVGTLDQLTVIEASEIIKLIAATNSINQL